MHRNGCKLFLTITKFTAYFIPSFGLTIFTQHSFSGFISALFHMMRVLSEGFKFFSWTCSSSPDQVKILKLFCCSFLGFTFLFVFFFLPTHAKCFKRARKDTLWVKSESHRQAAEWLQDFDVVRTSLYVSTTIYFGHWISSISSYFIIDIWLLNNSKIGGAATDKPVIQWIQFIVMVCNLCKRMDVKQILLQCLQNSTFVYYQLDW